MKRDKKVKISGVNGAANQNDNRLLFSPKHDFFRTEWVMKSVNQECSVFPEQSWWFGKKMGLSDHPAEGHKTGTQIFTFRKSFLSKQFRPRFVWYAKSCFFADVRYSAFE
jgi:hypothetical protein